MSELSAWGKPMPRPDLTPLPPPVPAVGPYDTERQALDEPMAREVRALHASPNYRRGDQAAVQLRHLRNACTAADITLGAQDERILRWLSDQDTAVVQVVIGWIARAYDSGWAAR